MISITLDSTTRKTKYKVIHTLKHTHAHRVGNQYPVTVFTVVFFMHFTLCYALSVSIISFFQFSLFFHSQIIISFFPYLMLLSHHYPALIFLPPFLFFHFLLHFAPEFFAFFFIVSFCLCFSLCSRYQINARTELAVRYNDISPLENHHCAVAFQIFSKPDCNIFSNFDQEAFKQIRQVGPGLHTMCVCVCICWWAASTCAFREPSHWSWPQTWHDTVRSWTPSSRRLTTLTTQMRSMSHV